MNKLILVAIVLSFTAFACTYSITLVNSQGTATDMVDEDQKATADVSAELKQGI